MKTWFQSRNRREQLLITAFAFLGAFVWLLSVSGRFRARWAEWHSTQTEVSAQQLWLERQKEIEARAAEAVRNLDPARTFDPTRLMSTVGALASAASLTPTIDPPVTQRTPQFAFHSMKVTFRRVAPVSLLSFYDEVAKQAPYLSLEQIAMQTERSAPGMLNVTLQISATQITKPGG